MKPLIFLIFVFLFAFSMSVSFAYGISTDGLVAYYPDNGTDVLGNYQGTNSDTIGSVSGKVGNSMKFNGSVYIDLGQAWGNFTTGDFTIIAWVNLTKDGQHRTIISKGVTNNDDFIFYKNTGDYITAYSNGYLNLGDVDFIENDWQFVAYKRNSTGSYLYFNDTIQNTDTSDDFNLNNSHKWIIGAGEDGNQRFFNGSIDELSIWNRGLTDSEIAEIWNNNNGKPLLPLIVNNSHPSCSDSYTRLQAMNPDTPFCELKDVESKIESGDTVIIAKGNYNGEIAFENLAYKAGVNITCEEGTNLTRVDYAWNGTGKSLCTLVDGESDIYNCTLSQSDSSAYPRVYYQNGSMFFVYTSYSDLTSSSYSEGSFWDNTPNRLYLKMPTDPDDTVLYVADDFRPFKVLNMNISGGNFTINGCNFPYVGEYGIYLDNIQDVLVEENTFNGGYYPIYVNNRDNSHTGDITIRNNNLDMKIRTFYWTGNDLKNTGRMETGAIHIINNPNVLYIYGNHINYSHGAIEIIADGENENNNSRIYNNLMQFGVGSQLEIEDYCTNSWYYNNTIFNGTFGASFASANASAGKCYFVNNSIYLKSHDYWDVGNYPVSYAFKGQQLSGVSATNWDIKQNTLVAGRGMHCITEPCWKDSNITDNIIWGIVEYAIKGSGLSSNGMNYDYNLLYNNLSYAYLVENYNSTSTDYASLVAIQAGTAWDLNSVESNPLFVSPSTGDFRPYSNSPACTMSSTGSYVGALPCAEGDNLAPSINFTSPTESNNSFLSRNYILVNVTWSDETGNDTAIIELYNSSFNRINRTNSSISPFFINFTNLADGIYYFNATANDTVNNLNHTETRTITIDTSDNANLTRFNIVNKPEYVDAFLGLAGLSSIFVITLLLVIISFIIGTKMDIASGGKDWFGFFNQGMMSFIIIVLTLILVIMIVIVSANAF